MEYSPEVLRRFELAQRSSELPSGSLGRVIAGEAEDRTLHVWVRFELRVNDGLIEALAFQVYGCPHTVAAASWVADRLTRRPIEFALRLDVREGQAALGVPVEKLGKLLRIADALEKCAYQAR